MDKFFNLTGWVVSVVLDFYVIGTHFEDGTPIEGKAFGIMIEDAKGHRYYHNHTFASSKEKWAHEEGESFQYFTDTESDDKRQAEQLKEAIEKIGYINLEHWRMGTPCYGSEAYASNWREYEAELESFDKECHAR